MLYAVKLSLTADRYLEIDNYGMEPTLIQYVKIWEK